MPQENQGNRVRTVPAKDTKPTGIVSTHATSGHLANRGPTEPLHSLTPHKKSGASRKEQEMSDQGISFAQAIAKKPEEGKHEDTLTKNKKSKKESWKERRATRDANKKRQNKKEH